MASITITGCSRLSLVSVSNTVCSLQQTLLVSSSNKEIINYNLSNICLIKRVFQDEVYANKILQKLYPKKFRCKTSKLTTRLKLVANVAPRLWIFDFFAGLYASWS